MEEDRLRVLEEMRAYRLSEVFGDELKNQRLRPILKLDFRIPLSSILQNRMKYIYILLTLNGEHVQMTSSTSEAFLKMAKARKVP